MSQLLSAGECGEIDGKSDKTWGKLKETMLLASLVSAQQHFDGREERGIIPKGACSDLVGICVSIDFEKVKR